MWNSHNERSRPRLERIARRAMLERGFAPDFSREELAELDEIQQVRDAGADPGVRGQRDLRELPWASIDNEDTLDIDQLTVAEVLPDNRVRILVAVADVEWLVKKSSAIDGRARQNTTSVYTAGGVFHMLPERLSTDLTSLSFNSDRPSVVVENIVADDGGIKSSDVYLAVVRNHARLAYDGVTAWLEGKNPALDESLQREPGLAENLRIQDRVARKLRAARRERGALELQVREPRAVLAEGEVRDMRLDEPNRAGELIQDFMIAANDATAGFLSDIGVPFLKRVVLAPKRWDRIIESAGELGYRLPEQPDAPALSRFLTERRAADPTRFPELSFTIVKLLGSGEYVVDTLREAPTGHFALNVGTYAHATAPNRRFPDLLTQRILKAVLSGAALPYSEGELVELARRCTQKEDDARKVERLVTKSAAAMLLSSRIGDIFEAVCTGAAEKGTWVRIFSPPIEGRLLYGFAGVDVGDRLEVRLVHTDVDRGFIDFERVHRR